MITVLFQDNSIVVCVKPVGIDCEKEMIEALQNQLQKPRIFCVHRLDKSVSGVMLYALNGKTAAKLSEMFSQNRIEKEYAVLAEGSFTEASGTLEDFLFHDKGKNKTYVVSRKRTGVKEASLCYSVLKTAETEAGSFSLLKVRLTTGRSHQIRVQFASRKHPLAGDGKYGSHLKTPIGLMSRRLCFIHPVTNETMEYTIPIPDELPWSLV